MKKIVQSVAKGVVGANQNSPTIASSPPPKRRGTYQPVKLTADDYNTMDVMKNRENMEIAERDKVKAMQRMAKSNFQLFMLSLYDKLTPYIALGLVIALIVVLVKTKGFSTLNGSEKAKAAYENIKSPFQKVIDWFKEKFAYIANLITPGYRIRLFFSMIFPFGGKTNSIPRPQLKSGRCDNHRWIQIGADGNIVLDKDGEAGSCFSAIRPKDIKWQIDISKTPEFYDIPKQLQEKNKHKMTITIPYDTEDSIQNGNTFFIPRCDKAYYGDNPDDKVPDKQMFEDTGTTCKMVSHPLSKTTYSKSGLTKPQVANELRNRS